MTPFQLAEKFVLPALGSRQVTDTALWTAIDSHVHQPGFTVESIGRSMEGRELRIIQFGDGPTEVLLWSQMHGDEATATRSLADMVRFLDEGTGHELHARLQNGLRITMLPILNPDGAAIPQRENAAGIDLNRDAARLVTPEATALRDLHARLQPAFGFNLHDQDVRRRAGPDGEQVAIAMLAPPVDPEGTWDPVRSRARLLASTMISAALEMLPHRVARWSDEFEARAFGEYLQRAGTSTVLVEAGALPDDPEKERLRRHLTALLLTALDAVASSTWEAADTAVYHGLPLNRSVDHDLHLTGGKVVVGDHQFMADVAVLFEDPVARTGARLAEVGDLGGAEAITRQDCTGRWVVVRPRSPDGSGPIAPEAPVRIEVREDGPSGPVVATY